MDIEAYRKNYELEKENWWFVSKRKIVLNFLEKFKQKNNIKILDVGCGTGANIKALQDFGTIIRIDKSKEALKFCKINSCKKVIRADIERKLPFKKESFDAITMIEVLEHTKEDLKVLKELYRICKKNGLLIVTVPAYMFLWGTHDELLHHKRRYVCRELNEKIKSAGFEILKNTYTFTLFPLPLLILRKIEKLKESITGKRKLSITLGKVPNFLNKILIAWMNFEVALINYLNLPFGTSIVVIGKKS